MCIIAETCTTTCCLPKAQGWTDSFLARFFTPPYHTPPPPPKVSIAPEKSTCTIANPKNTYVLINRCWGILARFCCKDKDRTDFFQCLLFCPCFGLPSLSVCLLVDRGPLSMAEFSVLWSACAFKCGSLSGFSPLFIHFFEGKECVDRGLHNAEWVRWGLYPHLSLHGKGSSLERVMRLSNDQEPREAGRG